MMASSRFIDCECSFRFSVSLFVTICLSPFIFPKIYSQPNEFVLCWGRCWVLNLLWRQMLLPNLLRCHQPNILLKITPKCCY